MLFMTVVFLALFVKYGLLAMFCVVVILGIWFNLRFSDSGSGLHEDIDEVIAPSIPDSAPPSNDKKVATAQTN
jgi:hypothetical protein